MLPDTSLDAGKRVAEKIRNNIEANHFVIDSHEIHTTVSFGVTLIPAYIDDSFELSYINADKALYYAKQNGKNKVTTL